MGQAPHIPVMWLRIDDPPVCQGFVRVCGTWVFGHKFPLKTLIPLIVNAVGRQYLLFFCCEVLVSRARSGPQTVLMESKMPCPGGREFRIPRHNLLGGLHRGHVMVMSRPSLSIAMPSIPVHDFTPRAPD